MRALIACALLAACATSPPASPPERVAGCWIARGDEATTTFRWLRDETDPARMQGVAMVYGTGAPRLGGRYALELAVLAGRVGANWTFCDVEDGSDGPCWLVAESGGGSLEGGRAFIDQHNDRLRISVINAEGERLIFDGRRDECD